MYKRKSIKRILSIIICAALIFGLFSTIPSLTVKNDTGSGSVYAASSAVKKYRKNITKNRKYIEKKIKTYKGKSGYLKKAKDLEKKSKNTTSAATLKSYDKKVESYIKKLKKIEKKKKNRISWYKAPKIAGKKSIKWSSVNNGCKKLVGIKYKWGGTTKKGFDCSGFLSYVMDKHYGLPYVRYTSSSVRSKWGNSKYEVYDSKYDGSLEQAIDDDRVRPGDIVVHSRNGKAYHVSIAAGYDWGPMRYDAYGQVNYRYLSSTNHIQVFRGLYTKPSTSKKISAHRNAITKISDKAYNQYFDCEDDYNSINERLGDAESYYNEIESYEQGVVPSTLTMQAKVLYDRCTKLGGNIKTDYATLETSIDRLSSVHVKARDSRKLSTLKNYKSQVTTYVQSIDIITGSLKTDSNEIDSSLVKLKALLVQAKNLYFNKP